MHSSDTTSYAALRRVASRNGFTFIELLVVVVIVGLLAAIAIPKFSDTKERAYLAAMKSDLKNLAGSNEAWYSDQKTYVGVPVPTGSPGVTLSIIPSATGWSAHAVHGSTAVQCDIQVGTSVVAPNNDGEPFCQ
jgi:prepilin-type N-terminal cleavage/methylation domain-containing protein